MLGSGTCLPACPCSRACLRKAHFSTWPLFPAWRKPRGQIREESNEEGQGDLEAGSKGMSDCSLLPTLGPRQREGSLATVQSGYEEDAVLVLKLVVQLTLVQERNEETIRATFPVSPQVLGGPGGGGVCACAHLVVLGKIECTRKPGNLYFNLQMSRMEDSSPLPPATLFFLSRGGRLE